MMSGLYLINDLSHAEIETWLGAALRGQKTLPRVTPDEADHLAIVRLEQMQEAPTRRSIEAACINLLRQFCRAGEGDKDYVKQLLALAAQLRIAESIPLLVDLRHRFKDLPNLALDIRHAVLAVLTMGAPPQPYEFWFELLQEDKTNYAARAISGALAWDKMQAVQMLPALPDNARLGSSTMLKLDMAWDNLPFEMREQFVAEIQKVLPFCGAVLASPIADWANGKRPIVIPPRKTSLVSALKNVLQDAAAAHYLSPNLQAAAQPGA
jgi:hypothetical protein